MGAILNTLIAQIHDRKSFLEKSLASNRFHYEEELPDMLIKILNTLNEHHFMVVKKNTA